MPPASFCQYNYSYLLATCVCVCGCVFDSVCLSIPVEKKASSLSLSLIGVTRGGVCVCVCVCACMCLVFLCVCVVHAVIPFPCPSCLLSFNNRPGNKDVAFSLCHVIRVVCSLSVRWPRLLSSMGDTHLHTHKEAKSTHTVSTHTPIQGNTAREWTHKHTPNVTTHLLDTRRKCTHSWDETHTQTQSQDADPSSRSHAVWTKRNFIAIVLETVRSVTDWQKSSRERKHIADVPEIPSVSTLPFHLFT